MGRAKHYGPRFHLGDPTRVSAHHGAHGGLRTDPLLVYTLYFTTLLKPSKVSRINMDKKSDDRRDLA